jgi:hypothetical protein
LGQLEFYARRWFQFGWSPTAHVARRDDRLQVRASCRGALIVGSATAAGHPGGVGGIRPGFDGALIAVDTQEVTKAIDDEETIRHVADSLEAKYPDMVRSELEAIVREEFGAIAGRPVQDYLSILTERAARKRIKKSIA